MGVERGSWLGRITDVVHTVTDRRSIWEKKLTISNLGEFLLKLRQNLLIEHACGVKAEFDGECIFCTASAEQDTLDITLGLSPFEADSVHPQVKSKERLQFHFGFDNNIYIFLNGETLDIDPKGLDKSTQKVLHLLRPFAHLVK